MNSAQKKPGVSCETGSDGVRVEIRFPVPGLFSIGRVVELNAVFVLLSSAFSELMRQTASREQGLVELEKLKRWLSPLFEAAAQGNSVFGDSSANGVGAVLWTPEVEGVTPRAMQTQLDLFTQSLQNALSDVLEQQGAARGVGLGLLEALMLQVQKKMTQYCETLNEGTDPEGAKKLVMSGD